MSERVLPSPALRISKTGEPTVSVVITCYNQAQFLAEAIESALQQVFRASEIVVVDDGSTDETPAVAARYPGVFYLRQRNRGLSSARNAGLEATRHRYVAFLDADDRLLPEALAAGVSCIEAHPEFAFVSGHYRVISADGSPLRFQPCACAMKDHYLELLRGNYIGMHAAVLYRRDVLERVGGFDRGLSHCEDYDLYLRIARGWSVNCHHKVVAEYRLHRANKSLEKRGMLRAVLRVLRAQRRHVSGHPDLEAGYADGIRNWQLYYGKPLIGETLTKLREPGMRASAMLGLGTLLRHYPRGLFDRLAEISAARAKRRA